MSDNRYYVRARGKVLGPFSAGQLRSLQGRGQLSRLDEVSEDRQNWMPASEVAGLFPAAVQPAAVVEPQPAKRRKGEAPSTAEEWFVLDAGLQQRGPFSRTQLLDMHGQGTLQDDTPVWTRGLAEWTPFAETLTGTDSPRRRSHGDSQAASVGAGAQAFVAFLKDPVGGLPGLCEALGPGYAFGLGLLFCVTYNLCALLGFVLVMSRLFGVPPDIRMDVPFDLRMDERPFRPALRPTGPPAAEQIVLLLKVFGLALLPMVSLAASIALIRLITRGSGNFGFDVLSAGAALLPLGLFSPLAGLLGPANAEVVFFLSVLALCLTLLILNGAFTRVVKLSDQGVILAIPATVVLTLWLCKVAATSILFR